MRRRLVPALGLACLLAGGPIARAEDVVSFDVEGQSDAGASDARTAALDDAFARATTRALAELVPADVRKARKAELDREIVGRARLWIAKFSVGKDATDDGRRQLTVTVRVDRDRIRAKLTELGVGAGSPAGGSDAAEPAAPSGARTVAVLVRVASPTGAVADYGADAAKDVPGVAAVTSALRAAGYAVKRVPAGGAAARATGDLPLEDDEADALAAAAKAELALVVGVRVGAPVPVRGEPTAAALVTVHARLRERGGHAPVGEGSAAIALAGDDAEHGVDRGIDRVVAAALADVLPAPTQVVAKAAAFHGDDTPLPEPGVVLVRLSSKTPFSMVVAEQKFLAGAKGVHGATLRRLSPGGWVIGVVTTDGVERVAQLARKPPATDTGVAVKIAGEVVEVELSGAP